MRRLAIALLLLTAPASAQFALDPGQLARVRRNFEPRPGDAPLRCDVTPLAPALNFAFRFQAGYTFHVPESQYPGATRGWSVLTAITPEDTAGEATYFLARTPLSSASRVDANFDIGGLYFLGVGRYSVESTLRDDRNRVCRKQWQIVVQPSHANRAVRSALPPDAVRQFSALNLPDIQHPDRAPPMRLSILLNAAAFSARRTVLRPYDRTVLLGALTALIEHLPTTSVRVTVFSLEQQREVFRSDRFAPPDLYKMADAIAALQLATVDVHVLQKPRGHVDFLAGLIGRELNSPDPADTVIFLGPTSRYGDRIAKESLPAPAGAGPRFFYVRYESPRRPPLPASFEDASTDLGSASSPSPLPSAPRPTFPQGSGGGGRGGGGRSSRGSLSPGPPPMEGQADIITAAVTRLKGKTLTIHSPVELARAIRKIERKR
jgi:hypothetical protein